MPDSDSPPADRRAPTRGASATPATYRTQLALDRTTLAWIRTTLTMATFGFGLVGFFRSIRQQDPSAEHLLFQERAIAFGAALLVLGTIATALAGLSQWSALRRLRNGETPDLAVWPLSLSIAVLVTLMLGGGLWVMLSR